MVKGEGTQKSSLVSISHVLSSDDEYYESYPIIGLYDRPLPFCGCGIGWFSFLVGYVLPLAWYYGAFLYLTNYFQHDPRERSGLAASAIMALLCSIVVLIVVFLICI